MLVNQVGREDKLPLSRHSWPESCANLLITEPRVVDFLMTTEYALRDEFIPQPGYFVAAAAAAALE